MPRIKKGCLEDSMTRLSAIIEKHQKYDGVSDKSMAHLIRPSSKDKPGMHERTFRNKVMNPETFTVQELAITIRKLHVTKEEILEWVEPLMED